MTTHDLDAARKTYHMEVGLLSYEHNYEELALAAQAYIQALEAALADAAAQQAAAEREQTFLRERLDIALTTLRVIAASEWSLDAPAAAKATLEFHASAVAEFASREQATDEV